MRSKKLEEVTERIEALHDAGTFLTVPVLRGVVDTLEILEPPPINKEEVQAIREGLGMSQAVFALMFSVSAALVRSWELGDNAPKGPALRLLHLVQKYGLRAVLV